MEPTTTNDTLQVGGFIELTAANCELFRSQMCAALERHTSIEIDMSGTTFMDCSGLGALIALRKCASDRKGVVRLVNPTPTVQRLFEVVRAGGMFEIVSSSMADPGALANDTNLSRLCVSTPVASRRRSTPESESEVA